MKCYHAGSGGGVASLVVREHGSRGSAATGSYRLRVCVANAAGIRIVRCGPAATGNAAAVVAGGR